MSANRIESLFITCLGLSMTLSRDDSDLIVASGAASLLGKPKPTASALSTAKHDGRAQDYADPDPGVEE
jgi:hypothetical protein